MAQKEEMLINRSCFAATLLIDNDEEELEILANRLLMHDEWFRSPMHNGPLAPIAVKQEGRQKGRCAMESL